jgi:hypothetical protein
MKIVSKNISNVYFPQPVGIIIFMPSRRKMSTCMYIPHNHSLARARLLESYAGRLAVTSMDIDACMYNEYDRSIQLVVMAPTRQRHHIDSLTGRAELMQADWPSLVVYCTCLRRSL